MNPAIIGPASVDVEKPSANSEKALVRVSGVLAWPIALLIDTWASMKPDPSRTLAAYSTPSVSRTAGKAAPVIISARAMHIGGKTPARSVQRPACTDRSMGMTASRLIRKPTCSGVALD